MPIEAPTWENTREDAPTWDNTTDADDPTYDQPTHDAEGLPLGLSEREKKRLRLGSEMAAAQAEGAKLDSDLAETERQERSIGNFTGRGIVNMPGKFLAWAGGEYPADMGGNFEPPFQGPLVHVPRPKGTGVAAGVGRVGAALAEGFTDPDVFVTLPAFAGGAIPMALGAAPMVQHLPDQVEQAVTVARDPKSTRADVTEAALNPVVSAAMLAGIAKGAQFREPLPTDLVEMPNVDTVARNRMAPGNRGPNERVEWSETRPVAPAEMVRVGEVPFQDMRRFGNLPKEKLEPLWDETKPEGGGQKSEVRREDLGVGGKLGFNREMNGPATVPEPPNVLREQVKLTADPKSSKAATHITPGETLSEIPAGLVRVDLPEKGTLIVNPAKAEPATVAKAAMQDAHGKYLGMGAEQKPEVGGQKSEVLQTRDKSGVPIQEEVVTPETLPAAQAAAKKLAPDVKSEVVPAEKVIDERLKSVQRPPSAAPETITGGTARQGTREETASQPKAIPAEGGLGPPRSAADVPPARRESRAAAARPWDLIDELEANYGSIDLASARAVDSKYRPTGAARKIFTSRSGGPLDKARQAVEGLGKDYGSSSDFLEAIEVAANARKKWREKFYREDRQLETEGKQASAFERDAHRDNARKEAIVPDTLFPGDQFELHGAKVRVEKFEFDENGDVSAVILEDGKKYGTQRVAAGEMIQVDKGSVKTGPPDTSFAPGLVSHTKLEAWADDVLSRDPRQNTRSGLDPREEATRLAAVVVKGAAVLERTGRDFAKWSKAMVAEFGEGIRPQLQQLYVEAARGFDKVKADAGELKQRKLAARGMNSDAVPKPHQERLGTDPAAFYEPQKMARVEDAVNKLSDAELAAVPMTQADGANNIWVAAQLELYRRQVATGNLDAAWAVMDNAMKAGTSLGQLVNQFKMLKGATPDGVLVAINKRLLERGADPMRPSEQIRVRVLAEQSIEQNGKWKQAEREYIERPTPENFERVVKEREGAIESDIRVQEKVKAYDPKSFFDTLTTVLQGNLLAPISIVANITGNMNNLALRGAMRATASVVDAVDAHLRARPRQQTVAPVRGALESGRAVGRSVPQAVRTLTRGATDAELAKVDGRAGLQPLIALRDLYAGNAANVAKKGGKMPIGELAARTLEASPFAMSAAAMLRLLAATDLPFREAAKARLVTEAMKLRWLNEGGPKPTPEQIRQAVRAPELYLDKAELERVNNETLAAVYQNSGAVSRWIGQGMSQAPSWGRFLIRTVAPYVNTPLNIVGEILSWTPGISFANTLRHAAKGNTRGAQQAAAKVALGGVVTAAGVWLYNKGVLAPGLDAEDEQQKGRMLSGQVMPPNHINISGLERALKGEDSTWRAGDETRDVMRGGGVAGALLLNAANTLRRTEREPEQADNGQFVAGVLRDGAWNSAGYVLNQSFTRGVAGVLDAVRGRNLDGWFMNYADALGAIAVPNTAKAISRAAREYKPEVEGDAAWATLQNVVKNKVGKTDALPYKRDLWGRPVPETPEGANAVAYQFLDITKARPIPDDPLAIELYTLWRKTGDNSLVPTPPGDTFTQGNRTYPLTKEQKSRLQELVGTNRRRMADNAVAMWDWDTITTEQKAARLRRIWERGSEVGRAKFGAEYRNELERKEKPKGFEVR
jgi:hypothetical protein